MGQGATDLRSRVMQMTDFRQPEKLGQGFRLADGSGKWRLFAGSCSEADDIRACGMAFVGEGLVMGLTVVADNGAYRFVNGRAIPWFLKPFVIDVCKRIFEQFRLQFRAWGGIGLFVLGSLACA